MKTFSNIIRIIIVRKNAICANQRKENQYQFAALFAISATKKKKLEN